jgi:RNA polymerase sigma-54 factor
VGKAQPEDRGWLSEKLADANWLVKALDQRQKTILKVASELVRQQEGFFRQGQPVEAADPARRGRGGVPAQIDRQPRDQQQISDVRARHAELKYFFTSGVSGSDGEGVFGRGGQGRNQAIDRQ